MRQRALHGGETPVWFIHALGRLLIPGRGEWVQWTEQIPVDEYAKLAGQFNPDKFDRTHGLPWPRRPGMKYTVRPPATMTDLRCSTILGAISLQ